MVSSLCNAQKKLVGKKNQFDSPIPELTRLTVEKEGRRAAAIIPKEEIKKIRKIGEGAHGTVFEGTWADEHGSVSLPPITDLKF